MFFRWTMTGISRGFCLPCLEAALDEARRIG